jgi:hypothetical protein
MKTMDRNPKAKKKVEYEDIFENSDKVKEAENDGKETQKDTMDENIKAKKVVKSVVKFS